MATWSRQQLDDLRRRAAKVRDNKAGDLGVDQDTLHDFVATAFAGDLGEEYHTAACGAILTAEDTGRYDDPAYVTELIHDDLDSEPDL